MKYVIEGRLGMGGMAEVFRGRQRGAAGFSRPVAIKRMNVAISGDEAVVKMFVEEAQTAALLQHPNIVSVIDFDKDETGALFLAMELIDGADLYHLNEKVQARGARFPFGLSLFVAAEALRGLGFAHEFVHEGRALGIVHRDVSPQNVLIGRAGTVKIADFGIAKVTASAAGRHTGGIKGKLAYMPPEQANAMPLDARADLYSIGVILYELLAGAPAFTGITETDLLMKVLRGDVAPLSHRAPDVPPDVVAIVGRLMAYDREHRFASAAEVIEALRSCQSFPTEGAGELSRLLTMVLEPAESGAATGVPSSVASVEPLQPFTAATPPAAPAPNGAAGRTPAPQPSEATFAIPAGAPPMPRTLVLPPEPAPAATPASTPRPGPPSGATQPAAEPSSLDAGMPAPAPRARSLRSIAALIGITLLAGVATVVVTRHPAATRRADTTAGEHTADAAAAVAQRGAAPVSAPPPTPPVPRVATEPAPPPATAGSPDASVASPKGPVDAVRPAPGGAVGGPRSSEPATLGKLVVRVKPWAHVVVDGRPAGATPIWRDLPAGKHRLRLENEDLGKTENMVVNVVAGHEVLVERSW